MVFDIRIREDNRGSDYTITNNGDRIIQTTVEDISDDSLDQWLREINRIYATTSSKKDDNLMVFVCPGIVDPDGFLGGLSYSDKKHGMLKSYVGSYCFLLSTDRSSSVSIHAKKNEIPSPFKGFICSPKVTLVALNIMSVDEKTLDLNELVEKAFGVRNYRVSSWLWHWYILRKLGKLVLGDEFEFNLKRPIQGNPNKIKYWEEGENLSRHVKS